MRYLIFIIFSFEIVLTYGQNNLQFYLEQAVQNSPVVKEGDNLEAIAELEQQRLVKDIACPKVSVTADYLIAPYFNNKQFVDTNPDQQAIGYDVGITNGGLYSGLVNISQPLFTKKTVKTFAESMAIEQQRYANNRELALQNLKQMVTDQYIKVYFDQQMISINNQLLVTLSDQVIIVEELVKAAIIKQSDGLLINLEKKNQQSIIASLQNQSRQDMIDLNTLCGLSDLTSEALEAPNLEINTTDTNNFIEQYKIDSLSIKTAAQVYETKYRPTVNLFGNAGLNAVQVTDIQRKFGLSAGVGLSIPIYDGHQREINRQKTKLSLNTISNYKQLKELEIENNRLKYKEAIMSLQNNIAALTTQKNEYDLLFKQFKAEIQVGQLSIIDYINSLKIYRQVQINLINLKKELSMTINGYNYWNW